MQDETPLTPAERELEAALAALQPAVPAMDRDALMFRAGRASARNRMLPWRLATAALALALTTSLAIRPEPRTVERIVRVPAETPRIDSMYALARASFPTGETGTATQSSYLRVRDDVLAQGADALPRPPVGTVTDTEPVPEVRRVLDTPSQRRWQFFGL
ncbi:MAG: hypothetical protein JXA69_10040 [Phycisphaerae bacterium]|nr:hypothetical protein [Phycisphaerae bacterium]